MGTPGSLRPLAHALVLSTPGVDCALMGMRAVAAAGSNVAWAADPDARLTPRALHDRFAD